MAYPGRRGSAALVALFGVCLALIHLQHGLAVPSLLVLVVSVVLPLAGAFMIVASAGWLYTSHFEDCGVRRITGWVFMGLFSMLVISLWTLGYQIVGGVERPFLLYLLANEATAGILVGLVIGVYDAKRIEESQRAKEANERLATERDRFASLFEYTPIPVMEYVFEGTSPVIERVNPAFEAEFGFDAEEIVGEKIVDVIIPPAARPRASALIDRLRAGEAIDAEIRHRTARGIRQFWVTTTTIPNSEPNRGFSVLVDVTERNRRDQRLGVLNRVLRHDLRNAMNVIAGTAEQLATGDVDPDVAAKRIQTRSLDIAHTADTARDIEELLRESPLTLEAIDLCALLDERARIAERTYTKDGFRVEVDGADVIVAAPRQLVTAIDHVIENAVVHNQSDEPRLRIDLTVAGEEVEVRFRDNGPGIPEREQEVFDFEEETELRHASGLGLWLVTWILSDTGGDVQFGRTEEGGTEVVMRLPLAESIRGVDAKKGSLPKQDGHLRDRN